jgi:hypothetical protein
MPTLSLFVSHASSDADLAGAVVTLVEKATNLPARSIRCTSVDGYRLTLGATTDDVLRREISEAETFVALVTPTSLASAYVLFELGARWASAKHLAPLMARGATAASLKGPVARLHAVTLTEREQVLQFIEDLAKSLGAPLEPLPAFSKAVDAVAAAAALSPNVAAPPEPSKPDIARPVDQAQKIAVMKMRASLQQDPAGMLLYKLAQRAGLTQADAKQLLIAEPDVVFEERGNLLWAFLIKIP